jgi:hypothetical protein
MTTQKHDEDRLFVRDGWRHYRRRYSVTEVRWGLATMAALLLIAGWVVWRGRHPDPELFADGAALLKPAKSGAAPGAVSAGPVPAEAAPPKTGRPPAAAPADRGALPAGLAGAGWREEKIAQFDEENLYVKINGRADFFRNFGFQRLYSVLLVNEQDPATTIDIEMYQHSKAVNALGAYGGERSPEVKTEFSERGLHHFDRNALYMARGPYYLRVIGSDENAVVTEKLKALATALSSAIEGEPLPWAYALFMGGLGVQPDQISYFPKNAFSLAVGRDLWAVRPRGKDDDLELFVAVRDKPGQARQLATELGRGFQELGEPAGKIEGMPLVKDTFLKTFTVAVPSDRWVVGVRGAASKEALDKELGRLKAALAQAPGELKARARPVSETGSEERAAPAAAPPAPAKAENAEAIDER